MTESFNFTAVDRRGPPRLPFWSMVSVKEVSADKVSSTKNISNESFASCVNISNNGMFLETFEKYNRGTVLSLNIDAPIEDRNEHYRFLTKVMHTSKLKKESVRGIGVQFIKKPKSLDRLIKS